MVQPTPWSNVPHSLSMYIVSGHLPPGQLPPRHYHPEGIYHLRYLTPGYLPPRHMLLGHIPPRTYTTQTFTTQDIYHSDICRIYLPPIYLPPRNLPPAQILLGNLRGHLTPPLYRTSKNNQCGDITSLSEACSMI